MAPRVRPYGEFIHEMGHAPDISGGSRLLFVATDATPLTNPTSLTSFDKTFTLPGGSVQVGTMLKVNASGVVNVLAGAGSRFTMAFRIGTGTGKILSAGGASSTTLATGDYFWTAGAYCVFDEIGVAAHGRTGGNLFVNTTTGVSAAQSGWSDSFTVDSTAGMLLDVRVALPTADGSNAVSMTSFTIEKLTPEVVL